MNKQELINWVKTEYRNVADEDIFEVGDEELELYCVPDNDISYCIILGESDTRYNRVWERPVEYYVYLRLHPGTVVRRERYCYYTRRIVRTFYIRPYE